MNTITDKSETVGQFMKGYLEFLLRLIVISSRFDVNVLKGA